MVIPCFRRAELTLACVDSLLAQDAPHDLEILLVDNAADPSTAALAGRSPSLRVLPQPHNRGFAGGCNVGLAAAQQPFVMVLNNDTQAASNLLSRLHDALLRDDRIAFAGPISNRVKGPAAVPLGDLGATAAGRQRIEREIGEPMRGVVQDVDSLSGLCLLGRRETWQHLGGFDERFMPGNFEDDDLCLRARLGGHRLVIARDAFLHHEAHRTFGELGIDVAAEIHRQHAVFRAKWADDPAGAALLRDLAGDRAGAAVAAEAAARAYPDWPEADWYQGRQLADEHRDSAAIPHLQALLQRCPTHTAAQVRLGRCWLRLGDLDAARQLWRAALSRCFLTAEQGVELLTSLGEAAQARGDHEGALAEYTAALELMPEDGALLNRLGSALVALRRFDQAIPLLERAAAAGLALAHTNLGICHFHAGKSALALEHFAAAAARLPDDPTAQANYRRARAAAPHAAI